MIFLTKGRLPGRTVALLGYLADAKQVCGDFQNSHILIGLCQNKLELEKVAINDVLPLKAASNAMSLST